MGGALRADLEKLPDSVHIGFVSIYDPAATILSKGLADHRIRADSEAIRQIPKTRAAQKLLLVDTNL